MTFGENAVLRQALILTPRGQARPCRREYGVLRRKTFPVATFSLVPTRQAGLTHRKILFGEL